MNKFYTACMNSILNSTPAHETLQSASQYRITTHKKCKQTKQKKSRAICCTVA